MQSIFLQVNGAGHMPPVQAKVRARAPTKVPSGQIHMLSLGEGDKTLLWLHANGMTARSYSPLLQALHTLLPGWRLLAPDLTGHGRTTLQADPQTLRNWQPLEFAAQYVLNSLNGGPLVLAGHSLGAVLAARIASGLAALHPKERIQATSGKPWQVLGACLVEPVLLPPGAVWYRRLRSVLLPRRASIPLAEKARHRQSRFASTEEVVARYRNRGMFARLPPEALRDYLDDGLQSFVTGGVALSCAPAWEAAIFDNYPGAWPVLRRLRLPVAIAVAGQGSTCPPLSQWFARRLPCRPRVELFADANHFLPMQQAQPAAEFVARAVQRFAREPG